MGNVVKIFLASGFAFKKILYKFPLLHAKAVKWNGDLTLISGDNFNKTHICMGSVGKSVY